MIPSIIPYISKFKLVTTGLTDCRVFVCGANNRLACARGATKVLLAFSRYPRERHTPLINQAIQAGIDFLPDNHPAQAAYPNGYSNKPSGNWWKFSFSVFYVTDILQIAEAAAALGYGQDPRLAKAIQIVLDKQDSQGRWALEYEYRGKTFGDYGAKKQPNPWVTLRALRMLKACNFRHNDGLAGNTLIAH